MIKFTPRLMVLLLCGSALAGCADSAGTTALNGKPMAELMKALAAETPADLNSGIRQATLLRQAEHYDEAVHILSQLMLVASDDARVVGEYGKTLAQMGRAQDATEFLGRAVQLQPNDWTLYSALGVAYDEVGDQASARTAYEHALTLKPGEITVLNNYALSRLLAKDTAGAEQLMARARAAGGANDPKIARNIALVDGLTPAPETPANKVAAAPVAAPAPAPAASQPKPVIAVAQPAVIVPAQTVTAAPLNPIGQPHPLQPAQKSATAVAAQTVPPAAAPAKPHGIDKFAAAPVAVAIVQADAKNTVAKNADGKPVATASVKTATVVAPLPAKTDVKPVQTAVATTPAAAKTDSKLAAKTDSKPVPDNKTSATVKTAAVVAPLPTKTDAKPVQTAAAKSDTTTPATAKPDSKPLTDTKLAARSDAKPVEPTKTANAVASIPTKTDAKPMQTAVAKSGTTTPAAAKPDSKPLTDTKLAAQSDAKPVAPVKTANAVTPVVAKTDVKPVQTAAVKPETTMPTTAKPDGKPVAAAPVKTASTVTPALAKTDSKPTAPTKVAAKTDGKQTDGKTAPASNVKTADAQSKNGVPALRLAADRF